MINVKSVTFFPYIDFYKIIGCYWNSRCSLPICPGVVGLHRPVGTVPCCPNSRNVWTMLSDIRFEFWGSLVWSQLLDLISVDPFQLGIFDVTLWVSTSSNSSEQKPAMPGRELLHVSAELKAMCSLLCTTASSCSCSLNKTSSWDVTFVLHHGSFQLGQFHVGNEIWKGKVRTAMFLFCMQQMFALRKSEAETTVLEMTEKCPCREQVPVCCYL